tara:strand:+ start:6361 stop:7566 length:1206 start_codon:yes stop_codon:yes gene_type:complete
MSILPWISYVKIPYIKISNLRIDGQLKTLKKEWDEESLHTPSVDTTIADFEIFPPSEYGISNYEEIEFDLYFGITDARYENNPNLTVEDFYDEELKNFGVYAIIHGYETKFRVSQKMKIVKAGSPLDESSLYWKTHINLSKDYFGDAIYISPYIESSLGSIFEDKKSNRGIFGGGEINKNTNFIKINFTSKEPPASGQTIPIEKVEFKKGVKFNTEDSVNAIPPEVLNEELWVSTEVALERQPYGYVNMDLPHIRSFLENSDEGDTATIYKLQKKLVYSEFSSSVIKTVVNAALIELIEKTIEAKESSNDDERENPEVYALENINEYKKNILGYFTQKIGSDGDVENDRTTSIIEALKYIEENGIDGFNSKLQVEIDKKVELKKHRKKIYDQHEIDMEKQD